MKALRLVRGDQLTPDSATIADLDSAHDEFLRVEVDQKTRYAPDHSQKVALVLSAMRHFAQRLEAERLIVD